ncbi:MAG: pyridoxal-phosphate dependent enzyme, partial [Acidimicrobiales bacterium]
MSPSTGVEVLANPMRGRGDPPPARDSSVRQFHRRFPDYAPSPLVDLPRLATASGIGRLLVKDESNRLGLPAFKMLGASWASYRALSERLGQEPEWSTFEDLATELKALGPMSLSTATDGNHGRAVASFARRTGLGARIFVPDGTSRARIEGIRSEGATCEVVMGTYEDAVDRAAEEAADDCLVISDTSWPGYETVPRWVIDGYATIFDELDEQLAAIGVATPDVVVIPIGVGAFAAAAGRWYRGGSTATGRSDPDPTDVSLIGVEPTTAACLYHSVEAGEMVDVAGPH